MSLRLAIPSDGALYKGTRTFLSSCGLEVERPSERRYVGKIPALNGISVLFQRQSDIIVELDEQTADICIVGLDRYYESRVENGDTILLMRDIGYGHAQLIIAVPMSWLDIATIEDLADLSLEFRDKGRTLRIATKYPRLTSRFLHGYGINHFTLVRVSGALEAAPLVGYADLIADVSATGATLRENHLRPLSGGVIMKSQAAIVGHLRLLAEDRSKMETVREFLERVEAALRSRHFVRLLANLRGASERDVAEKILSQPLLAGMEGPTISPVLHQDGSRWFEVQVLISQNSMLEAIDYFRSIGGGAISVEKSSFLFRSSSEAYTHLLKEAQRAFGYDKGGSE